MEIRLCLRWIRNSLDLLIALVSYSQKKNKSTKIQRNRYIYKKEQDLTCFQYDMVYVDFKDLPRKAISDKVLQEKAFAIVSNS